MLHPMRTLALAGLCLLGLSVAACNANAVTPPGSSSKDGNIVLVAGEEKSADHVRPSVYLSVDRLPAGSSCRVAVVLDVEAGWHVNTNPARPAFLVPTSVKVTSSSGTELESLRFPPGESIAIEGFDEPLSVYDGKIVLVGTLKVPASAAGQTEEMHVEIKFQACNDQSCVAPKTVKLTGKIPVAAAGETVNNINAELFRDAEAKLAQAKP